MATLSVLIPVFNEARTIETVIRRVMAAALPPAVDREVVVADDGSTDGTRQRLEELARVFPLRLLRLPHRGKSAALKAALAEATGDWIVLQDADLEYDPAHFSELLAPLLAGRATVVFGSRFRGRAERMAPLIRFANYWSTLTVNLLCGARLTDVNTGYKMLPRKLFGRLRLNAEAFGFDAELTVKLLRRGHRILEVPIRYVGRTRQEGKKIAWPAALHMYWCFIWYWLVPDG